MFAESSLHSFCRVAKSTKRNLSSLCRLSVYWNWRPSER